MKAILFTIIFFITTGKATNAMNNTMMIITIILGIILCYVAWLEDKKEKQERALNKERRLKIQRIVDRYKKEH